MGYFRLILSILVVVFHTSTLLGPIGYSAVFGFFIMSGYAVTLVNDKVYYDKASRFYINRLLRIYPSYFAVTLVSFVILYFFGNQVSIHGNTEYLFVAALNHYSLPDIINEFTFGYFTPSKLALNNPLLLLNGFPTLVTQAWTNSVELFFYLLAPVLVITYKRKKILFYTIFSFSILFPVITIILKMDFPTFRYRCVFGSLFVFLLGSLLYWKSKYIKIHKPCPGFIICTLLYILLFALGKKELDEIFIYISILLQLIIIIFAIQMKTNKRTDHICSILSIGIYMTQKISRACLLIVSSRCPTLEKYIGYGTNMFILPMLILSVLLSVLLYFCIDRPVERLRKHIRNSSRS